MGLGLAPGHPLYRRSLAALFLVGISAFGLMYAPQPVLVPIGREFGTSASTTSLLMSATTLGIALAVLPLGRMSALWGRARVLIGGLALVSVGGVVIAVAPWWWLIVLVRFGQGVGMAGVIVSAMAWVVDHALPGAVTRMGALYISGTTVGGMTGRILSGLISQWFDSWRFGILVTSVMLAAAGAGAHLLLPRTAPIPRPDRSRAAAAAPDPQRSRRHAMYAVGGIGMMVFSGIYTALAFRVAAPPFEVGTAVTGFLFLTYLSGTFTAAMAGRLAGRHSVAQVMAVSMVVATVGVLLSLVNNLATVIVSLLLLSAGFFAAHAVANATSARLSTDPSGAAARYALSYYLGSSAGAYVYGHVWDIAGWGWIVVLTLALTAVLAVWLWLTAGRGAPTGR